MTGVRRVTNIQQLAFVTDKHHHHGEHFAISFLDKMAKPPGRLTQTSSNMKAKGSFIQRALNCHSWTLSRHQNRRASAGLPFPSESSPARPIKVSMRRTTTTSER